jgi:hypothetical protein
MVKAVSHLKTALPNVRLQICVRLFTSLSDMRLYMRSRYNIFDEDQLIELANKIQTIRFKEKCEVYKTDSQGKVDYFVNLSSNSSVKITKLSFKVSALNYENNLTTGMKQPVKKLDVGLTYANSFSTLIIQEPKEGSELRCNDIHDNNDTNKISVYYSANPGSHIKISYYFTSTGYIVHQNVKEIEVLIEDLSEGYAEGAKKICLMNFSHQVIKLLPNLT